MQNFILHWVRNFKKFTKFEYRKLSFLTLNNFRLKQLAISKPLIIIIKMSNLWRKIDADVQSTGTHTSNSKPTITISNVYFLCGVNRTKTFLNKSLLSTGLFRMSYLNWVDSFWWSVWLKCSKVLCSKYQLVYRKYSLCWYTLGVLKHTTALDLHSGEVMKHCREFYYMWDHSNIT